MSKVNYGRLKQKKWKIRKPIGKPTKIIEPETVYNRTKEHERWQKILKNYTIPASDK